MDTPEQVLEWLASEYQEDPSSWTARAESARTDYGTLPNVTDLVAWLTSLSDSDLRNALTTEQGYAGIVEWLSAPESDSASEDYTAEEYATESPSDDEQADADSAEWASTEEQADTNSTDQVTNSAAGDAQAWQPTEGLTTTASADEPRPDASYTTNPAETDPMAYVPGTAAEDGAESAQSNALDALLKLSPDDFTELLDAGLVSVEQLDD